MNATTSPLCAAVRKLMNDAIYRTFRATLNADGEAAALSYLSQYFSFEGWARIKATLPTTESR